MFSRRNKELYQTHINNGTACFDGGDYANAILAFTQAIDVDPQNLAYFYRGQAHEQSQNYSSAAADFEDAERLGCKDINYLTRGLMYTQHLNQTTKALKDAIILFKKDMKSECAEIIEQCLPQIKLGDLDEIEKKDLFDSITTLEERGLLEIAISYLEPCMVKDDHNPLSARFWKRDSIMHGAPSTEKGTLKNIGDYVQEKKLKLAENIMQLAIQTGVEQFQAGDNEMAITTFSLVIEENPKCALAFYHRAEVHHHLNQHEAAIQDFCQAETLGLSIKTYKRSLSYAYLNKISEAFEDAIHVMKNGCEESSSAVAALCFPELRHHEVNPIPRRELFNFIKSLPREDQLHYLGIILRRGPLTVLGERFWKPQAFKLTSHSHIEDELLIEMLEYLKGLDPEITLTQEGLKKMDELIKLQHCIERLRYHICWQDCSESKQELSDYYSELLQYPDGYQFEDSTQYIEDFVYLGIAPAQDFVLCAIEELLSQAKDLYATFPCGLDVGLTQVKFIQFHTAADFSTIASLKSRDDTNFKLYEGMVQKYREKEILDRNITDHTVKPKDSLQQLRYTICYNKNYGLIAGNELKKLSDHYSEPTFTYQSADIHRYIEDFVYLSITTAEEFVRRAIKAVLKNVEIQKLHKTGFKFEPCAYQGLNDRCWIKFPAENVFSKSSKILTCADEKNRKIYESIWRECVEKEQRRRNITNRKYRTDDPIEMIRFQIALKKNNLKDYTEAQGQLTQYYSTATYQPRDRGKYIVDFIYLGMTAAEEFVRRTIKEVLEEAQSLHAIGFKFEPYLLLGSYWINFPAANVFSKDCEILTRADENNRKTYQSIWKASVENEQRRRNVSNTDYKTDDPIEQLRFQIALKKNNQEEYTQEQGNLAEYYLSSPESGLIYQSKHSHKYIEDFVYLGVTAALEFVRLAIKEILKNFESIYYHHSPFHPSQLGVNYKIEFQAPSIFSFGFGCKILTCIDWDNHRIYQSMWNECLKIEVMDQNITNDQYKTDDPIEQLRFQIAFKKNYQEGCTQEKEALSQYYLHPENHEFNYNFELYEKYLEDFLILDISAAKDFLFLAIEEKLRNSDTYKLGVNFIKMYERSQIYFPRSKLFSDGCTIYNLVSNPEHIQICRDHLSLAARKERNLRNVTNRKFKAKNEIEQLRLTLCIKKNDGENFTTERDALAARYEIPAELGGFEYSVDNANRYLEDFLYLEISEARDFILRAIKDGGINSQKCYGQPTYYDITFSSGFVSQCKIHNVTIHTGNSQTFVKMLHEHRTRTGLFDEKAALEYHYNGDPEDPDQIVYNLEDADKYVQDWLGGITTAESYVLRVMKEDFPRIDTILEKLENSPDYYEKLLNLIDRVEMKDIHLIWVLKFKNRILHSQKWRHSRILQEAHDQGVLSTLLEAIPHSALSLNAIISGIRDTDVISEVAIHLSHSNKHEVAKALFYQDTTALQKLKTHWDEQSTVSETHENDLQNGYFCLNEDIFIDYYYFSSLKDVDQLLNLAFNKNPKLFTELFCAEMEMCNAWRLRNREDFYIRLMKHPEMEAFSRYSECVDAINAAYSRFNKPQLLTTANNRSSSLTQSLTRMLNWEEGPPNPSVADDNDPSLGL